MSAIDAVWRDVRHGLRRLRQDRGLTVAALMSLSLGIGATTAIFQLIEALGLRALPVADPHALGEVARYLPARRASRLEPMTALGQE